MEYLSEKELLKLKEIFLSDKKNCGNSIHFDLYITLPNLVDEILELRKENLELADELNGR